MEKNPQSPQIKIEIKFENYTVPDIDLQSLIEGIKINLQNDVPDASIDDKGPHYFHRN